MSSLQKKIIAAIISFLIIYYGYFTLVAVLHMYKTEFNNIQRFEWIFNQYEFNRVSKLSNFGYLKKNDTYYQCRDSLNDITLWEFKEISPFDLSSLKVLYDDAINNEMIKSGDIWNKENEGLPVIQVSDNINFNEVKCVKINSYSTIEQNIKSSNYIGFIGKINKLSICDINNKSIIKFDYFSNVKNTMFLIYKKQINVYIILVGSNSEINESVLDMFNLN